MHLRVGLIRYRGSVALDGTLYADDERVPSDIATAEADVMAAVLDGDSGFGFVLEMGDSTHSQFAGTGACWEPLLTTAKGVRSGEPRAE
jgi:hypothetical protein